MSYQEFKGVQDPNQVFGFFREGLQMTGQRVTRESPLRIGDHPGHEFVVEDEQLNSIARLIVIQNQMIILHVIGGRSIHTSPATRRFLDSLVLLSTGK